MSAKLKKASGLWRNVSILLILIPALVACSSPRDVQDKLSLSRIGSFSAGGTVLGDAATRSLSCDHGHVEYFIPEQPRETSLFMWHSSSAAVWQNRWDGGEGFQSLFLKRGYPVYLWDGPRVGRADWGCEPYTYSPGMRDQGNFTAWRLGPAFGEFFPGVQYPTQEAGAWDQATRARYLEFDNLDNALLQAEAAAAAADRIGPVVALTSSAGGWRAMLARLKSDNIAGIVAYETPGFVFPEGEGLPANPDAPFGPYVVPLEEFRRLTEIPIQLVFGDNVEETQWQPRLETAYLFASIVNAHGGDVEVLVLPEAGLVGNTHIPMMDLNNQQVAGLLDNWLARKGLND